MYRFAAFVNSVRSYRACMQFKIMFGQQMNKQTEKQSVSHIKNFQRRRSGASLP
jgi:hypothetical protein